MKRLPATVTRGHTRDLLAVAVLFLGNGLVVGTFGGSLPGLRSLLDLAPGQIVGLLVAAGRVRMRGDHVLACRREGHRVDAR